MSVFILFTQNSPESYFLPFLLGYGWEMGKQANTFLIGSVMHGSVMQIKKRYCFFLCIP